MRLSDACGSVCTSAVGACRDAQTCMSVKIVFFFLNYRKGQKQNVKTCIAMCVCVCACPCEIGLSLRGVIQSSTNAEMPV